MKHPSNREERLRLKRLYEEKKQHKTKEARHETRPHRDPSSLSLDKMTNLETWLRMTNILGKNEYIDKIEFPWDQPSVPVTIKIKRDEEVSVSTHG